MPRTRSQPQLDFPKVKITRSSSIKRGGKKKVDNENVSPVKRPSRIDHKSEDTSPSKKCKLSKEFTLQHVTLKSPITSKTLPRPILSPTRMPLSPIKEQQRVPFSPVKDPNLMSPVDKTASVLITPTKKFYAPSPTRVRALQFSPERPQTPDNKTPITKGRSLDFSLPCKRNVFDTPVKDSPQKLAVLNSPLRASPRKLSQLNSPVRASPRKLAHLDSPVRSSPRKLALLTEPVRSSPRKHQSPAPSPFRLIKQEAACYQRAKQALHTALPERLVCREKEYKTVQDFLDKHLNKKTAGSLYISGAPGTGKTAVLSHTLNRLKNDKKTTVVYVNCMSFKNSQAIYNRVLSEITGKESRLSAKDAIKQLEKVLCSKGIMITMILDEIDQLDSKNQEILYTMFEWPTLDKSRLVLIGIANALDLTDRILPRLQARPKCKPQLMNFEPYTKEQIVTIIKDRLSRVEVDGEQVLDAAAIMFCARKVAAVAGDMRKALDVCRRAVEMVETDVRKQKILAAKTPSSPSKKPPVPKRIGVPHILKCVNEVYGTGSPATSNDKQTVPLQQKLATCTLLLMTRKSHTKEVTIGKLHESYRKICTSRNVGAVDQSEFLSVCTLIEARGIIRIKNTKEARNSKVTLKLDEGELEHALQDKTLVSSILQKGIPA